MSNIVYTFEPTLGDPNDLKVAEFASKLGYSMGIMDLDSACVVHAKDFVYKYGLTKLLELTECNEEVLSPSKPRSSLADLIRYMLTLCNPTSKFIIIDPYIFPDKPDVDYISFLESVFSKFIQMVNVIEIATYKVNQKIKADFEAMVNSVNSSIVITYKNTKYFHDRFIITDDSKGIYIGTSLNGIGRRFSLVDYLQDSDVKEILSEYSALS